MIYFYVFFTFNKDLEKILVVFASYLGRLVGR